MEEVHYWEKGAGHPLILIHGFCETSEIWSRFANALSQKFRIIVPDLPGFGKSPLPGRPFSIDDIASMMLAWIANWKSDRPVVIGHSLGGYVTLAMVRQQPSWFAGIGLFHSTAYADSSERKETRNKVIDFVKRQGVAPFIDTFVPGLFYKTDNPSIAEVHRIASLTSSDALQAYAAAMRDRHSSESVLESFPSPVLFIAGESDTIVPADQVLSQSRQARSAVYHSLANVAHMGMLENESASLKIVGNFMDLTIHFQAN